MARKRKLPRSTHKDADLEAPLCDELWAIITRARSITNDRMVRLPNVGGTTGKCDSTIWSDVKNGTLPPPVRIGSRAVAWKESEILACNEAKVFASRAKVALNMVLFVAMLIAPKETINRGRHAAPSPSTPPLYTTPHETLGQIDKGGHNSSDAQEGQ